MQLRRAVQFERGDVRVRCVADVTLEPPLVAVKGCHVVSQTLRRDERATAQFALVLARVAAVYLSHVTLQPGRRRCRKLAALARKVTRLLVKRANVRLETAVVVRLIRTTFFSAFHKLDARTHPTQRIYVWLVYFVVGNGAVLSV